MFTCSQIAGISVFGEKAVKEGKTIFIPNAINCSAFAYNEQSRQRIREELGLTDKYVIGHVGRFHYAKNHEYLLRVMAELIKKSTEDERDYVLVMLGEGSGMEDMKELAKELGIEKKVNFLGNHSDIYRYYQAMDYFVYPSRYEGLPGTVVEAQTAGLKCIISDRICDEVAVTDLIHVMSIDESPVEWSDYIRKTAIYSRRSYVEEMVKAGFDVKGQAQIMARFYETGKW